jgi:4-amino-4-deoxy-L-arabinose transferase-like glycosyltransferase
MPRFEQKVAHFLKTISAQWEWLLAMLCLPVALLLFDDFGLTWDASAHVEYGQRMFNYYVSGFDDISSIEMGNIRDKGPLFVLTNALLHRFFGLHPLTLWNLVISLFAILTLPPLAGLGRLFGNQRVAVFAVLALLMMPRFIGHAFTNPKDIPFACAVCWSMFAIMRLYHRNQFTMTDLGLCALSIGLALSMRPGGMFLFLYMGLIGVFWLFQVRAAGTGQVSLKRVSVLAFQSTVVFVLAWVIMISFWPYAHQAPILNPIRSLLASSSFDVTYPVLFKGTFYTSDQLPRYYMVWFLLMSTPLNILFLIIAGFISGVAEQFRSWRSPRSLLIFGVEVWVLFPLVYFVIFTPNIYDGIRHVLFILPGLALIAALGADYVFQSIRKRTGGALAVITMAVLLMAGVGSIFTMHPYQMVYFNALAGDPDTLHNRYETDYWVSSYKEGAEWINQRQNETERPLRILIAANSLSAPCALRYLDRRIKAHVLFEKTKDANMPEGFDYYLSTVRYGLHRNFPEAPVVHLVERNGIIFSVIKGTDR